VLQRHADLDARELERLEALQPRLLAARNRRVRPGRDENVLAAWNGLMIQGLCALHRATGSERALAAAAAAAAFVAAHLAAPGGGLYRAWRDGTARVGGFLDDHASMANAWFDLHETTRDPACLPRAFALVEQMLDRFWDDGFYFTARDAPPLVCRPLAPFDSAWPSGLSQGAFALVRAHAASGEPRYRSSAERIFERFAPAAHRNGFGFAHLLAAQEFARHG